MDSDGPRALQQMLVLRSPKRKSCRITFRNEHGRCPKCGRRLVEANTRSGWRHAR